MAKRRVGTARPAGQIRQSQIVTTFGPGSMVDLPDHAVIVGGLDTWTGYRDRPVFEERLAAKVATLLGLQQVEFFAPPPDTEDPNAPPTGITAWQFPEWFVAQFEDRNRDENRRSRPLVHRTALVRGLKYERERQKYRTVPVRFVQACTRGHVSDIDWRLFVHGKEDKCTREPLWMDERGTSGDLTDVTIRCDCGKSKALSAATKLEDFPLGRCQGKRPWLGGYGSEPCGGQGAAPQPSRLLIRSASNAYFAQKLSAISIPEPGGALRAAVDEVYTEFLQFAESREEVSRERRKPKVSAALERFSDTEVWGEVQRRKSGLPQAARGIREAEIETLLSAEEELGDDRPGGDFFARAVAVPPALAAAGISRIVKVHRLREVIVQIGFTRFEAAVPDVNGELALNVERAPLSIEPSWLPAVENRGEGVFVAFDSEAIRQWRGRAEVRDREAQLRAGFDAWKRAHAGVNATFPGVEYYLLHSIAHLLITSVSLDCGYAASSIRERIYAGAGGYGILMYTASPDAEGTLGGLVQAAERLETHFQQAGAFGELCSNDPVCAQHRPDSSIAERLLLGAACHGCLLLPESSCERQNDFLDRALVVPTVDGDGAAFFQAL